MRFQDRRQAGRLLARAVAELALDRVVVLGLPRGGVPVAAEVAAALGVPLDVWVVRKLGVPWQPELGMGAIAEGPGLVLDRDIIMMCGVTSAQVDAVIRRETEEVARRVEIFRGARQPPDVRGRSVVIVDDGVATGGTARAAIRAVRERGASRIVLAVPVGARETLERLRAEVDDIVCLHIPVELYAIGLYYDDFRQIATEEVADLLQAARGPAERAPSEAAFGPEDARQSLVARRSALLLRWKQLVAGEDELLEARDRDLVDQAADEREAELLEGVSDAEIHELSEIIAALARIEDGRYGTCERCGAAIAVDRLRALPETRLCAACAHQPELPGSPAPT